MFWYCCLQTSVSFVCGKLCVWCSEVAWTCSVNFPCAKTLILIAILIWNDAFKSHPPPPSPPRHPQQYITGWSSEFVTVFTTSRTAVFITSKIHVKRENILFMSIWIIAQLARITQKPAKIPFLQVQAINLQTAPLYSSNPDGLRKGA